MLSSYVGGNAEVFAKILGLYVRKGSHVADVTYGEGAFWRNIRANDYVQLRSDLKTGIDCRDLPYRSESVDAVVLDPPYMEGLLRSKSTAGTGSHSAFRTRYSNCKRPTGLTCKWHNAVIELYVAAAVEAQRILKSHGMLIVKCQDEICGGVQNLTHVQLILHYHRLGYYCRDLFVVTRTNRPSISRSKRQLHARKNHSYFLVFEKGATKGKLASLDILEQLLPPTTRALN